MIANTLELEKEIVMKDKNQLRPETIVITEDTNAGMSKVIENQFDVGFYGGKFIIPHNGHLYAMIQASTMCKELHIIVSYDERYEDSLYADNKVTKVNYKLRVRWWKQITKDMPHVHVHAVYEEQTGHIEDWQKGADGIKSAIGKPIDAVFSSEYEYDPIFARLYPEATHVIIDHQRSRFNISGTKIRQDGVLKHWDMIPSVVREHFVKKVVIVGTESNGKSTMVRNLASLYGTCYVEEIGRTFYEKMNDYNTLPEDFSQIAVKHAHEVYKKQKEANKILFVDTEAYVTQNFSVEYEGEDVEQPLVEAIAKSQKFDLWLFLDPDVEWVDDGTRAFGDQEVRERSSQRLKALLDSQGVKYQVISGNYYSRLNQAMNAVDALISR